MKKLQVYEVKLVRHKAKLFDDMELRMTSTYKSAVILKKIFKISEWHNERFGFIALDAMNEAIGIHIISEGTLGETAIYVREIVMRSLLNNASAVIIFHNHPGGSLVPSELDVKSTSHVKKALNILGIRLLDHIILTNESHVSLAEGGYI